jgi:XTP/dITP diphosphohydrolase
MMHGLVVATQNRFKLAELRALLVPLGIDVFAVDDVMSKPIVVVEDGDTFAANATKKAVAVAAATKMLTVADDSGLEVDALHGRPGVRSARFAHERATDAENNAALLSALSSLDTDPSEPWSARFRCVLALVDPMVGDGKPCLVEGACEGRITRSARGANGFGYDPLFVLDGLNKTMAELTEAEKNRISHRAKAFDQLRAVLTMRLAERDAITQRVCASL